MADLLEQGASFLDTQRHAHMTRPVVYQRGAAQVEVSATIGRTEFEQADEARIVLGDARLSIAAARPQSFDLLALDDRDLAGLADQGDPVAAHVHVGGQLAFAGLLSGGILLPVGITLSVVGNRRQKAQIQELAVAPGSLLTVSF